MKKYLKKSLALLLALMMALSTMGVMAMADNMDTIKGALDDVEESSTGEAVSSIEKESTQENGVMQLDTVASGTSGNLTWTLDDNGILTISGTGVMNDFSGYAPWYSYRESIETVIIESGVTSIGNRAFAYCSSLISVEIPDSVTIIGVRAFYNCTSLTSIDIPDGVTNISDYTFYYCSSLASINIPDGVTSIGNYAFYYCRSLTSIDIPDNVTSINNYTFYLL